MNAQYQLLQIGNRTEEMASEVFHAIRNAWRTYQDKKRPAKERAKAEAYIKRLWASAKLARKGPRAGGLKDLVAYSYNEMLPLAHDALEEYRDEERMSKNEDVPILDRRTKARDAAIDTILERLVGDRASRMVSAKRKTYRDKMERWNWLNRRADGLARDLTALHLGIKPSSVHVLRFRAIRKRRKWGE